MRIDFSGATKVAAARRRALGYCSKIELVAADIEAAHAKGAPKTLVVIHRHAGYKLLLRMLARRLGPAVVRGFPAAKTAAERAGPMRRCSRCSATRTTRRRRPARAGARCASSTGRGPTDRA